MRIIFMGTPDFAVPCFEKIIKDGHDVCAAFTQPDKPKGRGYELSQSPIKRVSLKYGVKVFQPVGLRDENTVVTISKLKPDIIIVVAYGKILTKQILDIPKFGCINVHGSLLPKYRGAAPIQWAVINGDTVTGVTTMYMDEGLDTGDIIKTKETEIGPNETSGELFIRLCKLGANLLSETLSLIEVNKAPRTKQENEKATFSKILNKSFSSINWKDNASNIHNLVRGLNPWPSASTFVNNKILKVHKTRLTNKISCGTVGKIENFDPVMVVCGDGTLIELVEVQYEGRKRMTATEFFRGHSLEKDKLI